MSPLDNARFEPGREELFARAPLTAVLGPTNTGKTHFALERMTAYASGMIGLPLRLLAREVYDKVVAQKGKRAVALVTGEEKIIPPNAAYWVCTVEAMPLEVRCDFAAIDEIQLCADRERGAIFTSRLLYARGVHETLLLGSDTMKPIIRRLFPEANFVSRARFSELAYSGHKKVSRLPRRSAIVAFSADAVYSIAELVRRQRGGAAVVMGALSPRTRNAQAELYQSGDVEYLVATDAIGMGLNMDIDMVGFAATRKWDGRNPRNLTHAELAQIAGRAGRHVRDGFFATTADCPGLDEETVAAIEEHQFDPVTALQWRSERLNFGSLHALQRSLEAPPPREEFVRTQNLDDELALRRLSSDRRVADIARGGAALKLLWEVCQTPDFRKVSPEQHARLLSQLYLQLIERGRIDDEWTAREVEKLDRTDGQVDALSNRIAHVRTWTYLSHRSGWLDRAAYWQGRTREIENRLSDALHERLIGRFVDRRTSVLLRKLKDDDPLETAVSEDGEVTVEGEFVGRLLGFQFLCDPRAKGPHAKTVRAAALKALRPEIAARSAQLARAEPAEFDIRDDASIWWRSAPVARLEKGPLPLRPNIIVSDPDMLTAAALERVVDRLQEVVANAIETGLGPLVALQKAVSITGPEAIEGVARGLGYRLVENFGAVARAQVAEDVRGLDQAERGKLRKLGVRFGEFSLFLPALLKPAPARLLILLRSLWEERAPGAFAPPPPGLTSVALNKDDPHALYYAAGFRPSGGRAVRIDMLERLADLIRKEREFSGRDGFEATSQMMSLVGCSGEEFEGVLQSLGYRKNSVTLAAEKATEARAYVAALRAASQPAKRPKPGAKPNAAKPAEADASASPSEAAATTPADGAPANADEAPAPTADEQTVARADEASTAAPQTDAPVADAAAATDATVDEAMTDTPPVSGEAEGAPSPYTPAPEAPAVEQAVENASTAENAEPVVLTLWRQAPRRPHRQEGRGREQNRRGDGAERDGRQETRQRRGKGAPGKPRGGPKGGPKGGRNENGAPHREGQRKGGRVRKEPDPNSPFAVLAALKGSLSDSSDKGSE
ncbi:MAG: helicase-related protein [Pseudomonadota bacterium]